MSRLSAKVLYIISATGMGGLERLFYNAVEYQTAINGVYFASIYAYRGDKKNELLRTRGVKLFFELKVDRWKNIFFYHHLAMIKILVYIKQNRINIFHAQDNFTMLYGVVAKILLGVKLLRSHHGAENSYWDGDNVIFRILRPLIDLNIFVSKSYLGTFAANNRLDASMIKPLIIYNGVPGQDRSAISMKDNETELRLIMVGNFYGGRDHLFAIKVLQTLIKDIGEISLTLIGNPDHRDPANYSICKDYIKINGLDGKVKILTGVSDVIPYLQESDLFVYESTRDTFGIAIVEALLCGIPCLVNDLDTFVEITQEGALCTLFRTGDLADCTEKALLILRDLPHFKEKAEKNIEAVAALYSMEGYTQNLLTAYKNVLQTS